TAGATGTIPHIQGRLPALLPAFEDLGWRIILLHKSGQSTRLGTVDQRMKTLVVVGNEGHGIDEQLICGGRLQAEIPSKNRNPGVESLNAAVAASIALYSLVSCQS